MHLYCTILVAACCKNAIIIVPFKLSAFRLFRDLSVETGHDIHFKNMGEKLSRHAVEELNHF